MAEEKKMSFLQRLRMKRGAETDQELKESHIVAYACGKAARFLATKVFKKTEAEAEAWQKSATKFVDGFIRRFSSGKVAEDMRQRSERHGQKVISLSYGQSLAQYQQLEKQVPMGGLLAGLAKSANKFIAGMRGSAAGGMGA